MKFLVAAVFFVTVFINVHSWNNFASWRDDGHCANGGKNYYSNSIAPNGKPAECNPSGSSPCCSDFGYCGSSPRYCKCRTCIDYRVRDFKPSNRGSDTTCHGGVVIAGQCLVFSNETVSWHEARRRCGSKNGTLASLVDPKAFMKYANSHYAEETFWLGGTDENNEGDWVWLDGKAFGSQFPWISGEPNNHNYIQHCLNWGGVSLDGYRTYDDGNCADYHKYVCEH